GGGGDKIEIAGQPSPQTQGRTTTSQTAAGKEATMIRTTLLFAAATLTVSLALAASASPALGANPPGAHVCGTVTGTHWQLAGKSGSQFAVLAYPAALCTVAEHAVARLTHARAR